MVRAPCCEKMGLKKGPWTTEEDQVLVAYIQKHGHGNWRALPKQAGLLRCGKSCRLRWANYLRPDIKRGNFTAEEEDTIIRLHEMLGNRWSAIAAQLPGRTDNEIKNVWHTHLKKRLGPSSGPARPTGSNRKPKACSGPDLSPPGTASPACSDSGLSSSVVTRESNEESLTRKEECTELESFEGFPEIDESFWSDALCMDNLDSCLLSSSSSGNTNSDEEDMSFWLKVFMESGDPMELPDV